MIHVGETDHGEQIMRAAGSRFTPVTMQVISRTEKGKLYGGVIYENYTGDGGSVVVHIAGFVRNWINRDLLWIMFDYPFRQLNCVQAFAQVAANNTECLQFCRSIGWKQVIRLEAVYPDGDMVLLRMWRDDCRFLNIKPRAISSNKGHKDGQAKASCTARL